MTDRELLQQASDVLEDVFEVNDWTTYNKTIEALRTRLAQPEPSINLPITNNQQASEYLEQRLWEFIDMAGAFPSAKTDLRTWKHVMVYAPKQPDADAVAWVNPTTLQDLKDGKEGVHLVYEVEMVGSIPLFEYQPEKEWVGLTDEEIHKIEQECDQKFEDYFEFANAIEAKLKEKNT
jgi:hypothetical protein